MSISCTDTETFKLYQEIPPVELRIGTSPTSAGRVEKFVAAGRLMARLDAIGRKQHMILSLTEAGQPLPQQHVDAMNLYLHHNKGLRSFKRVHQSGTISNKYAWSEFREKLNIPTLAVLVSV
jgi:hypothetical protein